MWLNIAIALLVIALIISVVRMNRKETNRPKPVKNLKAEIHE